MTPIRFLIGSKRLSFAADDAQAVMNLCMAHSIPYKQLHSGDETLVIELLMPVAKRLCRLISDEGIYPIEEKSAGLPHLLYKYRHRYGLFVGTLLFCLILAVSRLFVWDVRIEGEALLSEDEVKRELAECGLDVGCYVRSLEPDKIESELLMRSDNISWVSVNLFGTVAHVEIREHIYPDKSEKPSAANLIAECDGIIVGFDEVRGKISVGVGDLVREGELLVSGIYDSPTAGFNVTAASGQVFARVSENFSVNIPLEYEEKVYTGREYVEKYLIFYKEEIKILANCRNLPPKCDTIYTEEYLSIFDFGRLPFGIRTVTHKEYEYVTRKMPREEAIDEAFFVLRRELDVRGATDVLRKSFSYVLTDTAYILQCEVDYVKNIARQIEIFYTE